MTYYEDYLKSDWWKKIRNIVIGRDGRLCRLCGNTVVDIHHMDYRHMKTDREVIDCISLCRVCHTQEHINIQNGKKSLYPYLNTEHHLSNNIFGSPIATGGY